MHKAREHLRRHLRTTWEDSLTNDNDSAQPGLVPARVADVRRAANGVLWVLLRETNGLRETQIEAADPGAASFARAIAVALQRQRLPDWLFQEVVRGRAETALVSPAPRTPARHVDGQLTGVRLLKLEEQVSALLDIVRQEADSLEETEVHEQLLHALLRTAATGVPLHVDERLLLNANPSASGPGSVGASTIADEVLTRWQRWHEAGPEWVHVRVADIFLVNAHTPDGRYVVILQDESDPGRFLSIWVGQSEGNGIAVLLAETEMPRPFSIVLMGRLLSAAGGQVREVRINRLIEQTYYAEIVVVGAHGEEVLDARPSDALGVALHMRAPVYVAANLLEVAAEYGIGLPEPSVASRICDAMRETWNRPRWLKAAVVEG